MSEFHNSNFIEGFVSECVKQGLSADLTEHFYKQACFRRKTQNDAFNKSFADEFVKNSGAVDALLAERKMELEKQKVRPGMAALSSVPGYEAAHGFLGGNKDTAKHEFLRALLGRIIGGVAGGGLGYALGDKNDPTARAATTAGGGALGMLAGGALGAASGARKGNEEIDQRLALLNKTATEKNAGGFDKILGALIKKPVQWAGHLTGKLMGGAGRALEKPMAMLGKPMQSVGRGMVNNPGVTGTAALGAGGTALAYGSTLKPWMDEHTNRWMYEQPTGISGMGGGNTSGGSTAASDPYQLLQSIGNNSPMSSGAPAGGGGNNFAPRKMQAMQAIDKARNSHDYAGLAEAMRQKADLEGTEGKLRKIQDYGRTKLPELSNQAETMINRHFHPSWADRWIPGRGVTSEDLDGITSKVRALQSNYNTANSQLTYSQPPR